MSFYRRLVVERGESCSVDLVSLLCTLGIERPRCCKRALGFFSDQKIQKSGNQSGPGEWP